MWEVYKKLLMMVGVSVFLFFANTSYGSQFIFTCTNIKDKFQKTYFVDVNSKSILHISSFDIQTGKKYENLNDFIRIVNWNYPIVTGLSGGRGLTTFQYFDFKINFNTSSGHYHTKRVPFPQLFDCVR